MKQVVECRAGRGYSIEIESGILRSAAEKILPLMPAAKRVCVVADSNTAPLYAEPIRAQLEAAGLEASLFVFPAGETSKTLETVAGMYAAFAEHKLTRTDFAVAVGGGVTGDLCGFAAATYLRGIEFVQVPTSLLAQVDSSVGGKTGCDLPQGKNLVGAFWQPRLVLIDSDTHKTLPVSRFADGMAEVIKMACIKDADLFAKLDSDTPPPIETLIARSVELKSGVVERDERESGERTLLNFGHTLGHAIEKLQNFNGLSHGEAVAVGMMLLSRSAEATGLTASGTTDRIASCLKRWNLPLSVEFSASELAQASAGDKKSSGNSIKLVLLKEIGESYVHRIATADLESFLKKGEPQWTL